FDVMFNLLNQAEYKEPVTFISPVDTGTSGNTLNSFPGAISSAVEEATTSKFDLTLNGSEVGDRLYFHVEYWTKLFKENTIKRFITYLKGILQAVCDAPGRKIKDIEIITEAEKNRILYEFNDTVAEYPGDKTIHQLFGEQVERTPDRIGLVGNMLSPRSKRESPLQQPIQLTYRELNEKSNLLANRLQAKGVEPGTIVAIMIERSVEMIIGLLSILKTGAAYLPVTPKTPK
ncbi:MAG: AMP-binding protein, partial [bacterium]|nr:AMP-binding protein [bacterium]